MPGIKDKVAIVGMGCTNFGEHWDKDVKDLIVEACYEAFEDAGIEPKDIQAAWWSTMQSGHMGRFLAYPLKLKYIPITRVENRCAGGQDAFTNACYAVAAGAFDLVLVCGAEKLKDSGVVAAGVDPSLFYSSRVEPVSVPPAAFSHLARRYFHHYGISYEEGKRILSMIAVKNHHNGSLTPKAQFRQEITLEQAINAPMVSPPLGLFDCCGVTDGSAAAIITRAELARNFRDDYILVKGSGMSCGYFYQAQVEDDLPLVSIEENVRASRMAYEEAGIKDPRKEIDLAVVHDCFTITELVIYEDLGFSPRGRAKEDVEAGTFTLEGELPVNTDGGLKCFGHPVGASGLRMLYEIYKQLQGKAGPRQVKDARIGLAHTLGGNPIEGCTAAVTILGRRD
jgi:acetyl-CoA C-acetyltransferase